MVVDSVVEAAGLLGFGTDFVLQALEGDVFCSFGAITTCDDLRAVMAGG